MYYFYTSFIINLDFWWGKFSLLGLGCSWIYYIILFLDFYWISVQFSSVAQLCPTLCNPMDCSTPGLPVHHQLPELTHMMPSNHLILCHPLLRLPSVFPSEYHVLSNRKTDSFYVNCHCSECLGPFGKSWYFKNIDSHYLQRCLLCILLYCGVCTEMQLNLYMLIM